MWVDAGASAGRPFGTVARVTARLRRAARPLYPPAAPRECDSAAETAPAHRSTRATLPGSPAARGASEDAAAAVRRIAARPRRGSTTFRGWGDRRGAPAGSG